MAKFRKKVLKFDSVNKVIPTVSLGIGITNLGLNQKRIKQDREFHDSQKQATQQLANSLDEVLENQKVTKAAKKYSKKVSSKPYTEYVPGDISKKVMKQFRRKENK